MHIFENISGSQSYFKGNDSLVTLNLYKIAAKQPQVVDDGGVNKASVSEILFSKYLGYVPLILCNYKKLKRKNFVRV